MDTKTHRCGDCPQAVEHFQSEMCPSCGRCKDHCQGSATPSATPGSHVTMKKIGES